MKLAIRMKEIGNCENGDNDDDVWHPPATAGEASLRRARTVAAITASSRNRDDVSEHAHRQSGPRQEIIAGRGPLADAIRERAFAAVAGREQVRDVVVQFVTCARRGRRVRVRVWLDTGAIITIERDEEDDSTSSILAAEIVVAVERETSLQERRRQEFHES